MSGEKRAGNKRNKGKTAVWVILGLMLMVIVGIVFAYIKLESLNKTSAEFVEKPEIVLETEAELPVIVETPADIDEDFLLLGWPANRNSRGNQQIPARRRVRKRPRQSDALRDVHHALLMVQHRQALDG